MKISFGQAGREVQANEQVTFGRGELKGAKADRALLAEFTEILDKIAVQLSALDDTEFGAELAKSMELEERPQVEAPKEKERPECSARCEDQNEGLAAQLETDSDSQETNTQEVDSDEQEEEVSEDSAAEDSAISQAAAEEAEDAVEEAALDTEGEQSEQLVEATLENGEKQAFNLEQSSAQAASETKTEGQDTASTKEQTMSYDESATKQQATTQTDAKDDAQTQELQDLAAKLNEAATQSGKSEQSRAEESSFRIAMQTEHANVLEKAQQTDVQPQEVAMSPVVLRQVIEAMIQRAENTTASTQPIQAQAVNAADGAGANFEKNSDVSQKGESAKQTQRLPRNLASRTMEKVEAALKEIAKSRDGKTISVRLDPPSLGKVSIDVSFREGVLHARMVAESPQVNQLLREKGAELQLLLRKLGLNVDQVNVSVGSDQGFRGEEGSSSNGNHFGWGQGGREGERGNGEEAVSVLPGAVSSTTQTPDDHWIA